MDDALPVRGFKRLGDLFGDGQCFVNRNRPTGDPLRQVLALDHAETGAVSEGQAGPWIIRAFSRPAFALARYGGQAKSALPSRSSPTY